MMTSSTSGRRFSPLTQKNTSDVPALRGIVFDVDGTLCLPQNWMFGQMRSALGISKSIDILDHISSLPSQEEQSEAMTAIRNIELDAMAKQEAQPGLSELMKWLDDKGLRKGICTRNFDGPVTHLLENFLPESHFGPIITRDFKPPKPHPAGILHIAGKWAREDGWETAFADSAAVNEPQASQEATKQEHVMETADNDSNAPLTSAALRAASQISPKSSDIPIIMVGDSVDDMTAGYLAGAATVLLVNESNAHLVSHEHTDFSISSLTELIGVLDGGYEGKDRK